MNKSIQGLPLARAAGVHGEAQVFSPSKEEYSRPGKFNAVDTATENIKFTDAYQVPQVPKDPIFVFAPSTFRVLLPRKESSPHSIGNAFLDFLKTEVVATVLKVRPQKFW